MMRKEVIGREPTYFDIACRRIEDAQRQGDLFISGRHLGRRLAGGPK
jgi:hypothetical protein